MFYYIDISSSSGQFSPNQEEEEEEEEEEERGDQEVEVEASSRYRTEDTDNYRGHGNQCRDLTLEEISKLQVNQELCKNGDFLHFIHQVL